MNKLIIIGAGGHGKVAAEIAMIKMYEYIAFLDDRTVTNVNGFDVLGKSSDWETYINDYSFFVAIGDNVAREQVQKKIMHSGAEIATLVHPNAIVSQSVVIGKGTVIMAGVVINCCTSIGEGCIINTSSSIDHDNNISDYVHISPGAHLAGGIQVGKGTWIGIGASIKNNISIASGVLIGSGAAVVEHIEKAGVYVGVPAERINR